MNVETISQYCLSKKGAVEDFPFDEETLVFKVGGKMFALIPLEKIPLQINLKCDPEKAMELRDQCEDVQPGWHMSKKYWNTILLDGNIRLWFLRSFKSGLDVSKSLIKILLIILSYKKLYKNVCLFQ